MVSNQGSGKPTTHRSSPEEKASAVRMVRTLRAELATEHGTVHGTVQRVATQLGYGIESVRTWVKQADVDDGNVAGMATSEARRMRELEQENRELRRANEMPPLSSERYISGYQPAASCRLHQPGLNLLDPTVWIRVPAECVPGLEHLERHEIGTEAAEHCRRTDRFGVVAVAVQDQRRET